MRTKFLLLLCGLPAAGKSSFVREFLKQNKSFLVINKDSIRHMLFQSPWNKRKEKYVTLLARCATMELIALSKNIIIDETCCRFAIRADYSNMTLHSPHYGNEYKTVVIYWTAGISECRKRNAARPKSSRVSDEVMDKFETIFQKPRRSERLPIIRITKDMDIMESVQAVNNALKKL